MDILKIVATSFDQRSFSNTSISLPAQFCASVNCSDA